MVACFLACWPFRPSCGVLAAAAACVYENAGAGSTQNTTIHNLWLRSSYSAEFTTMSASASVRDKFYSACTVSNRQLAYAGVRDLTRSTAQSHRRVFAKPRAHCPKAEKNIGRAPTDNQRGETQADRSALEVSPACADMIRKRRYDLPRAGVLAASSAISAVATIFLLSRLRCAI